MGFITTRDNISGREVYACEMSEPGCQITQCKAHRCPFNWCQRYYICSNCWALPKIKKAFSKAGHESCRANSEKQAIKTAQKETLLNSGAWLRVAALSTDKIVNRVHVIFRNGKNEERGFIMKHETYDAYPLGENITLPDYQKIEPDMPEATTNIYEFSNTETT